MIIFFFAGAVLLHSDDLYVGKFGEKEEEEEREKQANEQEAYAEDDGFDEPQFDEVNIEGDGFEGRKTKKKTIGVVVNGPKQKAPPPPPPSSFPSKSEWDLMNVNESIAGKDKKFQKGKCYSKEAKKKPLDGGFSMVPKMTGKKAQAVEGNCNC